MDMENEEGETFGDSTSRGATLMMNIARLRARGETLVVEFSCNNQPIGRNGIWFRSYLGVLARTKILITYKDWKNVPLDIKDRIWDDVKSVFVGIEGRKKEEMQCVSAMWRNFKTTLTTSYITRKTAKKEQNPLVKYPFLTEEMWKEFVASRQTQEFLLHSEEQRKRQTYNLYLHTMSHGGYAGLEEILRKEKLEELKSMDPDSTVSSSSIVIPRHIKWKRGRMTKEGGYINEEVSQVAAKIDELDEQSSKGSFVSLGKNDILTTTLGTPEHSGRVRGFSGNVGLKKVFGKSDREPRFSAKDIQVMIKDGIKKELATFMSQMGVVPSSQSFTEDINLINKHEFHQSAKVSCPSNPNPFANVPEGGLMCHLFVDNDGARWEVAIGRVFRLSDKLHGLSLPINHMKVTVDIPLVKDSPVPVPTDKVQKVFQAIGSFLTWPMYLIELVPEEFGDSEVKKAESVKTKESFNQPKESEDLAHVNPRMLPTICIGLHAFAMQMKSCSPILIPIDAKVMNNAYDLYVSKADIYQLLAMSMLNTAYV